jgi:hypothetical protein
VYVIPDDNFSQISRIGPGTTFSHTFPSLSLDNSGTFSRPLRLSLYVVEPTPYPRSTSRIIRQEAANVTIASGNVTAKDLTISDFLELRQQTALVPPPGESIAIRDGAVVRFGGHRWSWGTCTSCS